MEQEEDARHLEGKARLVRFPSFLARRGCVALNRRMPRTSANASEPRALLAGPIFIVALLLATKVHAPRHVGAPPARPTFGVPGIEVDYDSWCTRAATPTVFTSHCSDSLSEFRGQRVLLSYGPGLDFVVAFWACLRAGAVAVPAPAAKAATYRRLAAISAAGVDSGSS